jgi:hypothetical protein
MFHVEFLGLPGSGKSALQGEVCRLLRLGGQEAHTVEEALLHALESQKDDRHLRFLLKILPGGLARWKLYALFVRSLAHGAAQNRFQAQRGGVMQSLLASRHFRLLSEAERSLAVSRLLETAVFYQLITEETGRSTPVVFDEGFAQRAASLLLSPRAGADRFAEEDISHYLDHIPIPDLLVHVTADLQLCRFRMSSRPEGLPDRMKDLEDGPSASYLKEYSRLAVLVAEGIASRGGNVIVDDNSGALEEAARRITREISLRRRR